MFSTERIFIRCQDKLLTGKWYLDEVEAEFAFEVNGIRFFFHDLQITDGLVGAKMAEMKWYEFGKIVTKEQFVNQTKWLTTQNFDKYMKKAKDALKNCKASYKNIWKESETP